MTSRGTLENHGISSKPVESGRYPRSLIGLVIFSQLAILILLYGQTRSFDYVFFDDTEYILDTPQVLTGLTLEGIQWAFTSFHMNNWHPLTWISYMLDVSLFGVDPGWAHLHNMLLHGVNSILVFGLLLKMSGSVWKAYILSIVFLAHPLHVESVAWIAERKDVLCAFFFLTGLLLYDSYRARPGGWRYIGVLITYALALLAKPMAVTFPIVLLILDFFVYRRNFQIKTETEQGYKIDYFGAVVEKLPLLALSIAASAVTIVAQDTAVMQLEHHSIEWRLTTATSAYITYLRQFLFPIDLIVYYPLPTSNSLTELVLPGSVLLALIGLSAIFIRKLPFLATGLSFYLITLLPVIGLVQVGSQAHADRYMYIPSVGLLIACLYLIPDVGKKYFQLGRAISIILIIYLSTICYWQVSYWKNRHTLFSRALDVSDENYMAHIQLASDYWLRKMLDESRQHLLTAISMRPDLPDAYLHMANIALAEKEFKAAESLYQLALSSGENSAELQNNLGIALAEQGRFAEATKAFEMALHMDPELVKARLNFELYKNRAAKEANP